MSTRGIDSHVFTSPLLEGEEGPALGCMKARSKMGGERKYK
jgi:hypothetical protein